MRNGRAPLMRGWSGRVGMVLGAAAVAIVAGCASGGGGRAVMTRAEIDALLAEYAGSWVLDESGSSPQISIPGLPDKTVTAVVSGQDIERYRQELEADLRQQSALREATFGVLMRRPGTLVLQAAGEQLVYAPTPGERLTLPLNGGSVSQLEGAYTIRTQVVWEGPRLGLRHMVGVEGQIRVVLEIADGQLRMTRTLRIGGEAVAPIVLVYDRGG